MGTRVPDQEPEIPSGILTSTVVKFCYGMVNLWLRSKNHQNPSSSKEDPCIVCLWPN